MKESICVLYASHHGHPWGGISTDTENILSSDLANKVNFNFVETSPSRRPMVESGRLDFSNILASFVAIGDFFNAVHKTQPDIVHISTAFGFSFLKHSLMVLGAKFLNKAIVLQPHCSVSTLMNPNRDMCTFFWNKYILFIIRKCDVLVGLSNEWLSVSGNIDKCKIRYIPNGLNLKQFQNFSAIRQSYHNPKTILFLGRIGRPKGIFDLLEAINLIKDKTKGHFRVVLVGAPNSASDLTNIKKNIEKYKLGEIISLLPPVYGQEKNNIYREADILVLPSHHEGMPMVVLEAMASGLPVVGTLVGGVPDLVKNGETGLLVPPGEPTLLGEALRLLIDDHERGLCMGQLAYLRVRENFDIERKAQMLFDCYTEVYQMKFSRH